MGQRITSRCSATGFRPLRRVFLSMMLALAFFGAQGAAHAEAAPPTLAILPFEIEDTSGEAGPTHRHDAMLADTARLAGEEIGATGLFSVVPQAKVAEAIVAVNPGTHLRRCNGCELDIAKRADARYVLIGWIYKVSTLVLTLHVDVKDVATGRTIYARVFDFRGDNQAAYAHAAKTMVRSLKQAIASRPRDASGGTDGKTRIAVFDFELEDKSAGGAIIAVDARDRQYLLEATNEAKRLLQASGRYVVADTGAARLDETARKYGVRNCHGCEAAAARGLGADAAMTGVITRVNRTEHTLLIRIVDARTSASIVAGFTDLRMGANYAWPRSAKWVMTRRILAAAGAR